MAPFHIRLTGWTYAHGGFPNPLTHRAHIRLRKVPLHLWNFTDIHPMIAGFGYPMRIAPYFHDNYDVLRILIACGAPNTIPRHFWLTVEPNRKIIDVEVEGWKTEDNGPPSPDDAESAAGRPQPLSPPTPGNPGPSGLAMLSLPSEPSVLGQDVRPAKRQRNEPAP